MAAANGPYFMPARYLIDGGSARDAHANTGWFLQAMGSSGLFEDVRITIATAVAWFHVGPRCYFRYWPAGRDGDSVRPSALDRFGAALDERLAADGPEALNDPGLRDQFSARWTSCRAG